MIILVISLAAMSSVEKIIKGCIFLKSLAVAKNNQMVLQLHRIQINRSTSEQE